MKICVATGNRAEEGLLKPVMDRIEKHPDMELDIFRASFYDSLRVLFDYAGKHLYLSKPDVIIIPCDRREMLMVATRAFFMRIPIVHFHAGDLNPTGTTYDEMIRPMISLMASCWLCNGEESTENIKGLLESVGRTTDNVHNVGSTAFDDIKIDDSLVPTPNYSYDLILYHPPTLTPNKIPEELDEIERLINEKPNKIVLWGYPNGDEPGSKDIIERIKSVRSRCGNMIDTFQHISRPQFLGLMKHCSRFIGNSSSAIYEAPMFLKDEQIIQIGNRNAGRIFCGIINEGASDRIIEILEGLRIEKI